MKREEIEAFLDRHQKVAFQFSPGKDSAACLKILEPWLDRITLVWSNAGNPYPEVADYMDEVWARVPHFVELTGNQQQWILENGWPVDIVPVDYWDQGFMEKPDGIRFQPFTACCADNVWKPMANWCMEGGYTGIIRGQKAGDMPRSPLKHGDVISGFEFFFPVFEWTDAEIVEFLGEDIPDSYKRGCKSSLDCLNCTAYVKQYPGQLEAIRLISPQSAEQIEKVHKALAKAQISHLKAMGFGGKDA